MIISRDKPADNLISFGDVVMVAGGVGIGQTMLQVAKLKNPRALILLDPNSLNSMGL